MAGKVFALGDLHLLHVKIWGLRNFSSQEAHDSHVIDVILRTVGARDTLVLTGDVIFASYEKFDELLEAGMAKFKGRFQKGLDFTIKVTGGNHDRNTLHLSKYISVYQATLEYKRDGVKFIFSHIPLNLEQVLERWQLNVHGHMHTESLANDIYVCTSWEQFERPIELAEILELRKDNYHVIQAQKKYQERQRRSLEARSL